MEHRLASPRSIMAVIALIGLGGVLSSRAQHAPLFAYRIDFTTGISQASSKFIYEGAKSQDPNAVVRIEPDAQFVLLYLQSSLDLDLFQASINGSGLVISQMARLRNGEWTERSHVDQDPTTGLPAYVDTGDPAHDNLVYELAKRAWLESRSASQDEPAVPAEEQ